MRSFSILGDSISTFEGCIPDDYLAYYADERLDTTGVRRVEDTWWSQVVRRLGGRVLANASFSGSLVEGAGFPAGSSTQRIAALSSEGESPDVIIVFMGINDYGWGGAASQAAGRGSAVPVCIDLASIEPREPARAADDAVIRFKDAYRLLLERARSAYPNAEVWCCTLCPGRVVGAAGPTFAYNLRGAAFNAYNDAICTAADEQGCRIIDVQALGRDYEAVDGTHPTARGMRQLAGMIMIASGEYNNADPWEPDDEPPASGEPCAEGPCISCAYARGTGSAWYLVCERDMPKGAPQADVSTSSGGKSPFSAHKQQRLI